jgi:lysophospholipase L1-like esterase
MQGSLPLPLRQRQQLSGPVALSGRAGSGTAHCCAWGARNAGVWVVVLCLCALLAACKYQQPPLPRIGPDDVVLAFGDSLTYGTGAEESESYPAVLAALIGRRVVRDGVPGEVTQGGLERLPASLEEHRPKLLLLCLGGNDTLQKVPPETTEANLRAMVQLARARGVAVVLIGVPRPLGGTAEYYARIAQALSIPLEANVVKDVLYDRSLKSDAIHPNAAGYRRMAEAIASLLRAAGAI